MQTQKTQELQDAINKKKYLLVGAYLSRDKNINDLIDGESIGHLLANDYNFLNDCANQIHDKKISDTKKETLIKYLSNMYYQQPQDDIEQNLYAMAEAAQANLRNQLKNLISLAYSPQTPNKNNIKAIDLNTDLFEKDYLLKKPRV